MTASIPTAAKLARLASKFHNVRAEWAAVSAERPHIGIDHDTFAERFRDAKDELTQAIVDSTPAGSLPPRGELDDLTPVGIAVIGEITYLVVTGMEFESGSRRLVIMPARA